MQETELIWRRFELPLSNFTEWLIALPVLFGLVVLFIIACLRQDKGIGTLLLGLCMVTIVPAIMSYRAASTGGWEWLELLVKIFIVGLLVGGFTANLLRELGAEWLIALLAGGLALLMHVGWVLLEK